MSEKAVTMGGTGGQRPACGLEAAGHRRRWPPRSSLPPMCCAMVTAKRGSPIASL